MNIVRLLVLPWMALSRTARGIGLSITLVTATVSALVYALVCTLGHESGEAWTSGATHCIAVLDCFLWALVLSQSLLLAREARRLRLPALGREAFASLAVYALLTIVLPALYVAWFGHGNAAVALVQVALGAGLGVAYATLPYYLGILVPFVPMLHDYLARWLPWPATSPGRFLAWAAPCVVALWLLIGAFWRSAIRHDGALSYAQRSILLTLRTGLWYRRDCSVNMESRLIGQRTRWLQPTVNLRGCGPGHPLRSLRVALGGMGLPQTPASRVRQGGVVLAGMLCFGIIMAMTASSDDAHADILASLGGLDMLLLYIGMASPWVAIIHMQLLDRRWRRPNTELPLLALLPGLGDVAQARRALLGASLLPPLAVQFALLLAMLAVAALLHLDARGCAMLVLSQLAAMGLLVACDLAVLGRAGIGRWWTIVLMIYGSVLIDVTCSLAPHSLAAKFAVAAAMTALWAGFLAPLAMLGRLGWRALQRQPHPFLAN